MKNLIKLIVVMYVTNVFAWYPMTNSHAYWPNQFGAEETPEWNKAYNSCVDEVFADIAPRYHSIYTDLQYAKYHKENNALEEEFMARYVACIHTKGYTDIDH